MSFLVDLLQTKPSFYPLSVYLDEQSDAAIEGDSLCLRTTHFAESGGQHEFSFEISPAMLPCERTKRFICSLKNSLGSDIDPAAGGHLAIHHQSLALVFVELFLSRPVGNNV